MKRRSVPGTFEGQGRKPKPEYAFKPFGINTMSIGIDTYYSRRIPEVGVSIYNMSIGIDTHRLRRISLSCSLGIDTFCLGIDTNDPAEAVQNNGYRYLFDLVSIPSAFGKLASCRLACFSFYASHNMV